jgi:hypothetical protein
VIEFIGTSLQLKSIMTATAPSIPCCTTSVFSSAVTNDESLLIHWTPLRSLGLTLLQTVNRPVYLCVKDTSAAYGHICLLSNSCWFVDVGHSLRREVGSVVYNCCFPSPPQSFSGQSPVLLATILYSLIIFETSRRPEYRSRSQTVPFLFCVIRCSGNYWAVAQQIYFHLYCYSFVQAVFT